MKNTAGKNQTAPEEISRSEIFLDNLSLKPKLEIEIA